jgi:hypothetical protein
MSDLLMARAALCDLLLGRRLRSRAEWFLTEALDYDSRGLHELADTKLDDAAHWEWIAIRCEHGQILWGGRLNRCGYQPEHD